MATAFMNSDGLLCCSHGCGHLSEIKRHGKTIYRCYYCGTDHEGYITEAMLGEFYQEHIKIGENKQ